MKRSANTVIVFAALTCIAVATALSGCMTARDETPKTTATPRRLNVLLIMLDDLNAGIGAYGGPAITPHMDRLAAAGVLFENAYSVVPVCNPSRVALMTGQRPETTGQYLNEGDFRDKPGGRERVTLPQWMQARGYVTASAGKVFHQPRGLGHAAHPLSDPSSWNAQAKVDIGTGGLSAFLGADGAARWLAGATEAGGFKIWEYFRTNGVWGAIDQPARETGDFQVARYCADFLRSPPGQPFMLACGLSRPHAPHIAPKEFFDLYPIETVQTPDAPADDLNDVPTIAQANWTTGFARALRADEGEWRRAVRGYLASTSFADAAVGEILTALEASGRAEDTIVILMGDNGFQLGQKFRWEKNTLWDLGGRTTLIMRIPGVSPRTVAPPVSLLDIFPTLAALTGAERPTFVEGRDLTPLIADPALEWSTPAVQTHQEGNIAVRLGPWNYIRYRDGSEELYNLDEDPREVTNLLAQDGRRYAAVVAHLRTFAPKTKTPQGDYNPWR